MKGWGKAFRTAVCLLLVAASIPTAYLRGQQDGYTEGEDRGYDSGYDDGHFFGLKENPPCEKPLYQI